MPARRRLLQAYDLYVAGTVLQVKNLPRLQAQLAAFEDYTAPYVTLGQPWVGDSR